MVRREALKITDRQPIIEAVKEFGKMSPDTKKIKLLINRFNELGEMDVFTLSSFRSCGDCRKTLKNFWTNIVNEWEKK